MRKYEVALALASTRDTHKLALARMILDMMELDELYTELNISPEDITEMEEEEIFELLGIDPEERSRKLEEGEELKNYDVALALATAGKIEEARKVMEAINPKKELTVSDFRNLNRKERDLHDRLFTRLKENNLPQPEVPRENKYYFREIAVGWKALDMKFNLKKELSDFVERALEKLDGKYRELFEKQVELNLIDRITLNKIVKKELADRYPAIKPSLLKFIDYVCIVENTAWIIEGKKKLNYEAIGQVNVLSYLFSNDYPQFSVKKAIVCEESDPLIEDYCEEFDIKVMVFHQHTI